MGVDRGGKRRVLGRWKRGIRGLREWRGRKDKGGRGNREGRGAFLCLRTPPVLTGQTPEAPWSSLASGLWGPPSPYPSLWTLPWYLHHQNRGSSFPPGLRAWIQQPPPLLPALPRLQLPHWPTTGMLRPTDTPQVASLGSHLGTGSVASRLPWRPRILLRGNPGK